MHLINELAAATGGASTGALVATLGAATWTDLKGHRIPNAVSLTGLAAGLVLLAWGLGLHGLLAGLAGAAVGLMLFLPFYATRGMGAGDVKLMAAAGAYFGPMDALLAGAASIMAGGVLGLMVLAARGGLGALLRRYGSTLQCLFVTGRVSYVPPAADEPARTRFPYALAILGGSLAAYGWLSTQTLDLVK